MRHIQRVLFTLLFLFIPLLSDAVDPFTVRVIYFQPKDAPPVPDNVRHIMEQAQQFYEHEMLRHGYGNKTFRIERDVHDDIIIHTVHGKHAIWHYANGNTYAAIEKELPFDFKWDNVASQDQVHIIVAGGLNLIDNAVWGVGWPISGWRTGGNALVAGQRLDGSLAAHELGHAFGLYHTDVPAALMGPGDEILLDYEARWLHRHHYFNDVHVRTDIPAIVEGFGTLVRERGEITYTVKARSNSGLYHCMMCRSSNVFVLGNASLTGKETIGEVVVPRRLVTDGESGWFQVMDINGNYTIKHVERITKPGDLPPVITKDPDKPKNKNPDIGKDNMDENNNPDPEKEDIEECPGCVPDDTKDLDNTVNPDFAIHPEHKLTTRWAHIKMQR